MKRVIFILFSCVNISLFSTEEPSIIEKLSAKVLETIEHSEEVPGLRSEQFALLKEKICRTWKELVQEGVVTVSDTDKEVRPNFVALQGIMEHVLSLELKGEVKALTGIIHTPMPATPLCSLGEVSKELVDQIGRAHV